MGRISKTDSHTGARLGGSCPWCHYSPFRRTIHLLNMKDEGKGIDDIRSHLAVEFPHQAKEFHAAEILTVEFVLQYYSGELMPPWIAWQREKTSQRKIDELRRWLQGDTKPRLALVERETTDDRPTA